MRTTLAALGAACTLGCANMANGNAPNAGDPAAAATTAVPADMAAAMRADAARRAGVSGSQVQVVQVRSVTWRDAALGCPREGMAYAQVLVPGWQVRIDAGGQAFDYHASRRGTWLWCPAERVQEPLPGDAAI